MFERVKLMGDCPTIYGPVFSRRHGKSLGINLGNPIKKICTWGCVYCQCGFGERRDFEPTDGRPNRAMVIDGLNEWLDHGHAIDSVTFAGNSEPGTHPEFLEIVRDVLEVRSSRGARWIVNCLSNGSEIDNPSVRQAYGLLDEAWLKLDCGIDEQHRRLSRPIVRVADLNRYIESLATLPHVRLQTLFWSATVDSLGNWDDANRRALLQAYKRIKPVEVHVTTVSRMPALELLTSVDKLALEEFAEQVKCLGIAVKVFA